jgi:hypothetical protein
VQPAQWASGFVELSDMDQLDPSTRSMPGTVALADFQDVVSRAELDGPPPLW